MGPLHPPGRQHPHEVHRIPAHTGSRQALHSASDLSAQAACASSLRRCGGVPAVHRQMQRLQVAVGRGGSVSCEGGMGGGFKKSEGARLFFLPRAMVEHNMLPECNISLDFIMRGG